MRLTRPVRLAVPVAASLALVLSGCGASGGSSAEGSGASASGAFPVTIDHALGSTTIEGEPTRVVTWGFGSTDAALALGVVPVAIPTQTYGGDDRGVLPWIGEALEEMEAETPTMLPEGDGSTVPFEAIAAARPDVILASYSGITAEDYATLSELAPTVAYPDQPWTTPWRDVVTTVGTALGREDDAEQLVADTDEVIARAAAEHPELAGKSVAAVWDTAGSFYVYKPADPRVEFLGDLGLTVAPSVEQLGTDEATFYSTLSYERVPELTSDILLSFATTQEEADAFLAQPYAELMPQVASGHVATMVGEAAIAAVSPPTVLSLTYSLDDYLAALSGAA